MNKIPLDELELLSPTELGKILLEELTNNANIYNTQYLKNLINAGADLDIHGGIGGWTPLQLAARTSHVDGVKMFIEAGSDLEARDNDGWTPLHYAVTHGRINIVKLLIEAGVDINSQSNFYNAPLHRAVWNEYVEVIEILIEAGVSLNVRNDEGRTPWDIANHKVKKAVPELNPNFND